MADLPPHARARRAYGTPTLIAYGAVKDLTAGGSGPTAEFKLEIGMFCMTGMNANKSVTLC